MVISLGANFTCGDCTKFLNVSVCESSSNGTCGQAAWHRVLESRQLREPSRRQLELHPEVVQVKARAHEPLCDRYSSVGHPCPHRLELVHSVCPLYFVMHVRKLCCSLGSTRARASRRNTFGAQKRLGTAEEQTRNGCTDPSYQPPKSDNRSCHGVRWGVGCGGRASWSVGRPLSEHRGPSFFSFFFGSRFLFIPKHKNFPV